MSQSHMQCNRIRKNCNIFVLKLLEKIRKFAIKHFFPSHNSSGNISDSSARALKKKIRVRPKFIYIFVNSHVNKCECNSRTLIIWICMSSARKKDTYCTNLIHINNIKPKLYRNISDIFHFFIKKFFLSSSKLAQK